MKRNIFQLVQSLCWTLNIYGFDLNFRPVYKARSVKLRFVVFSVVFGALFICECCALAFLNLHHKELNRALEYTFGHATLIGKFSSVFLKRKKFNDVLKVLFCELPEDRMTPHLQLKADGKARSACFRFLSLLAISTFFLVADEAYAANSTGTLFDPLILWMPAKGDVADWIQVSMVPCCYFPVCILYGCFEVMTIVVLIYIEVRFKEVALWLQDLKAGPNLKADLSKVVRLHAKTLKCAEEIQEVFGTLYGMQLLQSVFMMSFSVMDFLTNRHAIPVLAKTLVMVSALLVILSQYTWTAGDVTVAALSVSDAVGRCAWEECGAEARKALVLVAMRAQKPLLFRGFSYVVLSHGLFVAIVQRTYSVIALLY